MNKKVSRQGTGIQGKKCLEKEMGTGLKREEEMEECSFREGLLEKQRFLGQEILWTEDMVDENRGKEIGSFCKQMIIMIYH